MLKIGITGPIGSGKSYISKLFAENHGIPVFDSDSVAKELQVTDDFVKTRMIHFMGSEAYNEDGSLNRSHIANIIFNDNTAMERILDIVRGPLIARMYRDYYGHKHMGANVPPFMLIENAIMMNEKSFHLMDKMILVSASYEVRMQRAIQRGMSPDDFIRRNAKQMHAYEMECILERHGIPSFLITNEGDVNLASIVKTYAKINGWKEGNTE